MTSKNIFEFIIIVNGLSLRIHCKATQTKWITDDISLVPDEFINGFTESSYRRQQLSACQYFLRIFNRRRVADKFRQAAVMLTGGARGDFIREQDIFDRFGMGDGAVDSRQNTGVFALDLYVCPTVASFIFYKRKQFF